MKITVDLSADQLRSLHRLIGTPAMGKRADIQAVVNYVVYSIAEGVRRPGSWERQVVLQLFGDVGPDA